MKKSKSGPKKPGRREPVQYFSYGPLDFNVNKALVLAGNTQKYQPQPRWPAREWVGPYIEINEHHIEQTDLSQPIIFATFIKDGRPCRVLIDGNHRVLKALNHQQSVIVLTLDLEDSFKIMKGPGPMMEQMKRDGQRLGLLSGEG